MGDILEICKGVIFDDNNLETILVTQKDFSNNGINKRRSDITNKGMHRPSNSYEEKNISAKLLLRNGNTDIYNYEYFRNGYKKRYANGLEDNLENSISRMSQIIELLESQNKILTYEKNEMQKENEKLAKEIIKYKDTISKFKNHSGDKNDSINAKEKIDKNKIVNRNKDNQIKMIFLFKNYKKFNEENTQEIMAYRYEMFIEVKLRLLKIRNLGPTDIKSCYYNSREINDWYTLEELNFYNNAYVVCEFK